MCGLCGMGDAAGVTTSGHQGIWPADAAQLLAAKGLSVADAAALFGGAVAPALPDDVLRPEADETGFNAFFDIPSGTGTPYGLFVGQRINAEISVPGDTDWFGMNLVQGQTYQISLRALPFSALDPEVYLFDNFGNFLIFDDNSGGGNDALLTVTATRTGVYFVGATGFGGTSSTVGQYEISLAQVNFAADTVGQTAATAGTIAVDSSVNGTIDYGTDQDWYKVTVQKGKTYAVFLDSAQLSFTPLANPKVEVLDKNLTSVAFNDDNGITRNAALTFTADYNGVYYIKALGGPANTGDFTLTVADFTPPAPPDPTDAIDWGVKFNKTEIRFYFASQGETFAGETTDVGWNDYEKGQAEKALREYSNFSKLTFVQVGQSSQADFKLVKNFEDTSTTGRMFPQDPDFGVDKGVGWFNTDPDVWSRQAGGFLEKGAFGYSNFIHEFGHGLGLSHPHDNGGTSAVLAGVSGSGDMGDNNLNQEVFTVMSYIKGWKAGPNGSSGTDAFGIARTPMAFDVAVIQEKYGVNTTYKSGNDTYKLWDINAIGTGYECIWDTGGTDTISYTGNRKAVIDLREATLKGEVGGGGFLSWVEGIFAGYTIAKGAKIENATGGSAADTLVGNALANALKGNSGSDTLRAGAGNDTLNGDIGRDKLFGQNGRDKMFGGAGNDRFEGGKGNDRMTGNKGLDDFVFKGRFGNDTITDFAKGKDDLLFDDKLWTGTLTKAQVVTNFADVVGGNVVFDFGTGKVLTLLGIGSTNGLADDIVFI